MNLYVKSKKSYIKPNSTINDKISGYITNEGIVISFTVTYHGELTDTLNQYKVEINVKCNDDYLKEVIELSLEYVIDSLRKSNTKEKYYLQKVIL